MAMRGIIDVLLCLVLFYRFQHSFSQFQSRVTQIVYLFIFSIVLFLLELLGLWHLEDVKVALQMMVVFWPLVILAIYLKYKNNRLQKQIGKMQFEIDWRKEYQEVVMEELDKMGYKVSTPQKPASLDGEQ